MYVVFEGPDGAGKTTAVARVAELLRGAGLSPATIREPSGRPAGLAAMSYLVENTRGGTSTVDPYVAALLMTAQRVDLAPFISEKTRAGEVVLSDRSFLTTYVYQDAVGVPVLDALHGFDGFGHRRVPLPDLVVYLSVDPDTALRRARARGREFFSDDVVLRVAGAYRGVVDRWNLLHPDHQLRFLEVDAVTNDEEVVSMLVVDTILGLLGLQLRTFDLLPTTDPVRP